MSIRDLQIPYLQMEEIRQIVQDFNNRYNPSDSLPVDIEFIIEKDLNIELIVIPGLRAGFGIDGFISNTFTSITVDEDLLEKYPNRYRLTLAHEIAHMILHKNVYHEIGFEDIEDWKNTISAFDPKQYFRMEYQADMFAGLLLAPYHHLKYHFNKAIDRLIQEGFDIEENQEMVLKYVSTALSKVFETSPSSLQVRIKQEDLLTSAQ